MTRTNTFKYAPAPWASALHLLLLLAALGLFLGRTLAWLRLPPLLALDPGFYSHVSNFSISFLLCAGVGQSWLLLGVPLRKVLWLALAIALVNVVYEGFIPLLNTRDWIDALYGVAGTLLATLWLGVQARTLRRLPAANTD